MLIPVAASAPAPALSPAPATAPPTVSGPTVAAGPGTCPQCGTAVIPGEAFCDNCGASLLGPTTVASAPAAPALPYGSVPPQPSYPAPQAVGVPPQPSYPAPQPQTPFVPPAAQRNVLAPAQLLIIATGVTLPLPASAQAQIGRGDAASKFFPEIDLTNYGALENGVGRRHARLLVQGGQVLIEDLDSTNGTFVNGQKLAPRTPRPLTTGDELRLGNLLLRIQF